MKHPPYHLRPNKAVDRFLLVDIVDRVVKSGLHDIRDYCYYGFGGPFLDDFRVFDQHFPEMSFTSIEQNSATFARQLFHKFSRRIRLVNETLERFLSSDFIPGRKDIFWLDYTNLKYSNFELLQQLVPRLGEGSLVKVTVPAQVVFRASDFTGVLDSKDIAKRKSVLVERFERRFDRILPPQFEKSVETPSDMAHLIVQMIQNSIESITMPNELQIFPVCSVRYSDNMPMVSVTMMVVNKEANGAFRKAFGTWPFKQLSWKKPILVDLPILSAAERIKIQRLLPLSSRPAKQLTRALGYLIDSDDDRNQSSLDQYASFHRYYPLFARVDY